MDECAKGWTSHPSEEHWSVYVGKKVYPRLPLGKHGRRDNPEIEAGHVRGMARHFDLVDCFKRALPSAFQ
jgi:hypothetical protein